MSFSLIKEYRKEEAILGTPLFQSYSQTLIDYIVC